MIGMGQPGSSRVRSSHRPSLRALGVLILLTVLGSAIISRQRSDAAQKRNPATPSVKKDSEARPEAIQTHRNVGKAYYEQGKYEEALAEFQKVIASAQALATDHLNLGLALMQANKLDAALGELTTAKQMDPNLLAADYNLGILYKRELRYPDAETAFKRVMAADPEDPPVWFNLGTVYFAQKKLEEALEAHRRVLDMGFGRGQNFYVASLFHTFTILVRLKRQPEAQKFLKIHEQVRDRVPNISLQNPALEGGKYGAILVPFGQPTEVARMAAPEKVAFLDITTRLGIKLPPAYRVQGEAMREVKASEYSLEYARRNLVPLFGLSISVGDYDGDGRPDLYLVNPAGTNRLLHSKSDGTFIDVTEKAGVAGPGASLSATFADYNNSGHPSLFVAGMGGITLYRNSGDGTFLDLTEKAGLRGKPGELDTRALLFDADSDGFLDLVVTAYTDLSAPPEKPSIIFPNDFPGAVTHFYRNNGDGTFADATASAGLAGARGRARGAVFADFNNDGYADLLLIRDDGPPLLYFNQGEDKFVDRTAEAGAALAESRALDAQAADFDHDGNFDLVLWSLSGYQILFNQGGGKFTASAQLPTFGTPPGIFAFRGAVADIDGDSFDDLLVRDGGGMWHVMANRGGHFQEAPLALSPSHWLTSASRGHDLDKLYRTLASLAPAFLGDAGKLNLLGFQPNGELVVFEKEGPPMPWLEVDLHGFKSNSQGIGSVVELKAGNFYKKIVATENRVRTFTGERARLDVVRVTWPNAVVQNWINVATNKPLEVRESERLASSCPLLYVWNGQKYSFLTDVLGVAPLGELLPDGGRLKPNPAEYVRLLDGLLDQHGVYTFQLTDELREVDYIDQLRLTAVDHPATEEIYADEVFSSSPPSALRAVRGKRFPISAVDDHGHDVLPLIREVDGQYPADFSRNRILGLADSHSLTLDLGDLPKAAPIALYLRGWVFWTDSNAARALMSNSQLQMVPPYLQVRDPQGRWVTAIPDMGLPSGTNRTMRVDLTGKFLSSDHHVRIVTNLCVYWDQIFFTTKETLAPSYLELPLVFADLHYRGFSTPSSDPHHLKPDSFDYDRLLNEAPWNPMVGNYTRYGAVDKLLTRADDRLVVMATGDELTVKFSGGKLPRLEPGWKRDFFLEVRGWAKDGEPNTAYSKTVDPLPFRRMSNYPYGPNERYPRTLEQNRYLRRYQTRPSYLLIPPLAPTVR